MSLIRSASLWLLLGLVLGLAWPCFAFAAAADSEGRPTDGTWALYLTASGENQSEVHFLLREVCETIRQDAGLAQRYPHVFVGSDSIATNIDRLQRDVRESGGKIEGGRSTPTREGHTAAMQLERLIKSASRFGFCLGEGSPSVGAVSAESVRALDVSLVGPPGFRQLGIMDLESNNYHWHTFPYDDRDMNAAVRVIVTNLLATQDDAEKLLNADVAFASDPGLACDATTGDDACVLLGSVLTVRVEPQNTRIVPAGEVDVSPVAEWTFALAGEEMPGPLAPRVHIERAAPDPRPGVRLRMRELGRYRIDIYLTGGKSLTTGGKRPLRRRISRFVQVKAPSLFVEPIWGDTAPRPRIIGELSWHCTDGNLVPGVVRRSNLGGLLSALTSDVKVVPGEDVERVARDLKQRLLAIPIPESASHYAARWNALKAELVHHDQILQLFELSDFGPEVEVSPPPKPCSRQNRADNLCNETNSGKSEEELRRRNDQHRAQFIRYTSREAQFCEQLEVRLLEALSRHLEAALGTSIDMKLIQSTWQAECVGAAWQADRISLTTIDQVKLELTRQHADQPNIFPQLVLEPQIPLLLRLAELPSRMHRATWNSYHHGTNRLFLRPISGAGAAPGLPLKLTIRGDSEPSIGLEAFADIIVSGPSLAGSGAGARLSMFWFYSMLNLGVGFGGMVTDLPQAQGAFTIDFDGRLQPWCYAGPKFASNHRFCHWVAPALVLGGRSALVSDFVDGDKKIRSATAGYAGFNLQAHHRLFRIRTPIYTGLEVRYYFAEHLDLIDEPVLAGRLALRLTFGIAL